MRKYCDICGIEIADTDYDSWYRFISVKYCDECRIDVRKEQKKNSKKKQQVKKRAENAVSREEQRLSEAEYVAQCKTEANRIKEQRSQIREVPSMEQELKRQLRRSKADSGTRK